MVERTIGDWPIRYGGFRVDGLHVWGATARILGQLGAVLAPEAATRAGGADAAGTAGRAVAD
jgi:hypothetical protein